MYREERIRSFKELRDRVRALDEDEGIRIFGRVKGFRNGGFIFLGIYVERYCVMIRDRVWDPRRGHTRSALGGSISVSTAWRSFGNF